MAGAREGGLPSAADRALAVLWAAPPLTALALFFPSGGYFVTAWGVASLCLLLLLAAATLAPRLSVGGRWGAAAMLGWAGLATWQGLSSLWSDQPSASIEAANLTVFYGTSFMVVLLGIRRARDLGALLHLTLLTVAAAAAYSTTARLFPSVVSGDEQARLSTPITYQNGLGALVAFGALLALGLAGHPRRPLWSRAAVGALVPLFLLALLLTYSRGALAALLVGVCVLCALAPGRLETIVTAIGVVAVSFPLLVYANGEDAISAVSGELPPHGDAGRQIALLLLASMLASAGLTALMARLTPRLSRRGRRAAGLAIAAALSAAIVSLAVVRMPAEGPVDWIRGQVDSFKTYDPGARAEAASLGDRLVVAAGSGRWQHWEVAAEQFRSSPLAGTGAGDFRFRWDAERDIDHDVLNAHSLYLEVLAESGVIGLGLLLGVAGAVLAMAVVAVRRAPPALGRDVAVAAAAFSLVAIHAGGDWTWQLPAVFLPAVAVAAGALKGGWLGLGNEDRPSSARWAIMPAALAAAVLVAAPVASTTKADEARRHALAGNLGTASETARDAAGLSPLDPAPHLLRANILTDLRRPRQADAAFAAAVRRSPRDWAIWADWSAALLARGDIEAAARALHHARRANPREVRVRYLSEAIRERAGGRSR